MTTTTDIALRIEAEPLFAATHSAGTPYEIKQLVFRCPNGYGLSVVEGPHNYCSARRDPDDHTSFEVALIHWAEGAADDEFDLVYAELTPFAYDVCGWQDENDIAGLLLIASRVTAHTSSPVFPDYDDEDEDLT